jgi:hypothetical protein
MESEPTQIGASADGARYVQDITWSGWGSATATGTGTLEIDNCNPNCGTGTYTAYPATVTLSGLVAYSSGAEAYSQMVISAPDAPVNQEALTFSTGLVP